jgi:hypothetical protein
MMDEDSEARAINAQPWKPMRGMVKLRCVACFYYFAARDRATQRCPDCEIAHQRELAREGARKAQADAA